MNDAEHFDAIIFGAGLAGLTLADALVQKNKHCAIIDPQQPGAGTSGAPLMLLNPATGRRAKMGWKASECMKASLGLLERVQKETDTLFFEKNGVVRPAIIPELAKDFQRAPEKYNWPDNNWVKWLDQKMFSEKYPVFKHQYGGLVVRNAATVNGRLFMKSLSGYLARRGLRTFYQQKGTQKFTGGKWVVSLDDGRQLTADHVIHATGHAVSDSQDWNFLPVSCVKGQAADFEFNHPLPLKSSISSMGYMAFLPAYPNHLVVGSTYEHNFRDLQPDDTGLESLRKKLEAVLPGIQDDVKSIKPWAGVRVTTADRNPVLGEHPEKRGLFVFTALGSKGLIISRHAAELLAEHILSKQPLPEELSIQRYLEKS